MEDKDLAFLKQLVAAPSPSGYEQAAARVLRERLQGCADEVCTNVMGSVHGKLAGKGTAPSVMLAGHIDEVGLIVVHITDDGYLCFDSIGGVDAVILPGMRVDVHCKSGDLRGVVGRKPIHLIAPDDRKTVTPIDKLFIDLGLDGQKVKELVRVGDCITMAVAFEELGDGFAVSRAFDDKVGVWIATRVMEEVKAAGGSQGDLYVAGTVQEEIGLRGGETSAYGIDPYIGIAIEVTHATDYPDCNQRKDGTFKCGAGPVIARGPNINPRLFDRLEKAAQDAGIEYQIEAEPRGTGTDANKIQLSRGGKVAGLLSVPLRYMHTPTEVLCLADVEACVKLLTRFVLDLDQDADFIPA
ncbi:MAG: M42 family metallopeptidase [Coriobacteriales bacterium]|nr:M42 family metallopeptidase [Coriobacteriales bacterium]MBQ6585936.1 M42 family metallopeptidase [Coriobacteriales bacterium]